MYYSVLAMPVWSIVMLVILGVITIAFVVLAILGNKMQKKQEAAEANMMVGAQTVSMLIIDKKMMKMKDAGFPDIVINQTPRYLRGSKVPVVKAKVGPQIHTLMCDSKIFDYVPVKKEVKATVNGIYIINVKGIRGPLEAPQEKPGFWKRVLRKSQQVLEENKKAKADTQNTKKKNK